MKTMYKQLTMNGATPHERTVIIQNSFRENKAICHHFGNLVSDMILNISESELIQYLGKRSSRKADAPIGEIKISPSKITVSLPTKVYEKLHLLAINLSVSKSVILHSLYFAIINGRTN